MDYIKLRAELSRDEGRRLMAYKDSLGYWTVGVGHLLGTSPRMSNITEAECDALLNADIEEARLLVVQIIKGSTDLYPGGWNDVRVRALINMAFNLGEKLHQFVHFLDAVRAGQWEEASKQMLQSLWAKQVGGRAVRLSEMIRTGEDGSPQLELFGPSGLPCD
jgi:lysozyme